MIALLALAAVVAQPSEYVTLSSLQTGDFVQQCAGTPTDLQPNLCVGYIMGIFDALSLKHEVCVNGTGATTLAAVAASRKYLADHPEQWNQHSIFIIQRALKATFPCGR